jgi:hypothetical protein
MVLDIIYLALSKGLITLEERKKHIFEMNEVTMVPYFPSLGQMNDHLDRRHSGFRHLFANSIETGTHIFDNSR